MVQRCSNRSSTLIERFEVQSDDRLCLEWMNDLNTIGRFENIVFKLNRSLSRFAENSCLIFFNIFWCDPAVDFLFLIIAKTCLINRVWFGNNVSVLFFSPRRSAECQKLRDTHPPGFTGRLSTCRDVGMWTRPMPSDTPSVSGLPLLLVLKAAAAVNLTLGPQCAQGCFSLCNNSPHTHTHTGPVPRWSPGDGSGLLALESD